MAAVLMSNPLHLAVLGNPKRKKATASKRRRKVRHKQKTRKENPMARKRKSRVKRKTRSRKTRSNPAITKGYARGLTSTPGKVMDLFKGRNKVKNAAYAAGGAVATYAVGGMVAKALSPFTARIPFMTNPMVQRVTGALVPYTLGFAAAKTVLKKQPQLSKAVMIGGGLASLVELVAPGQVGRLIDSVPGVRNIQAGAAGGAAASVANDAANGPVAAQQEGIGQVMLAGMGEYVSAPGYAGTGEYVSAPGYAGTGEMLADDTVLAGNFLEESNMYQPAI